MKVLELINMIKALGDERVSIEKVGGRWRVKAPAVKGFDASWVEAEATDINGASDIEELKAAVAAFDERAQQIAGRQCAYEQHLAEGGI